MVIAPSKNNSTLNSWKEIATFLGRGVRTVQRWERELGLPVRRLRRSEHSPVFAFRGELEAWLNSRPGPVSREPAIPERQLRLRPSDIHGVAERAVRRSQRLVRKFGSLLVEQRTRTEALAQSLTATVTGIETRKRRGNYNAEHTHGHSA
jgi:hypothetical protein